MRAKASTKTKHLQGAINIGPKNFQKYTGLPEWAIKGYELDLDTDLMAEVDDWVSWTLGGGNEYGTGLTIYGPPGTGKTVAAVSAAVKFNNNRRHVYYMRSRDFMTAYQERLKLEKIWMARGPECAEFEAWQEIDMVFSRFTGNATWKPVDLLVLDDFGKEHGTEFAAGELDHVIRKRGDLCLPTILTMNIDATDEAALDEKYCDGFGSYLRQVSDIIPAGGENRR